MIVVKEHTPMITFHVYWHLLYGMKYCSIFIIVLLFSEEFKNSVGCSDIHWVKYFSLYLSGVYMCHLQLTIIWLFLLVVCYSINLYILRSHYWLHTYFKLLLFSVIIINFFTFNLVIDIFVMYSNFLSFIQSTFM